MSDAPSHRLRARAAIAILLGVTACGGASVRAKPPPVLSPGAVSYLPSSYRLLTADALAREVPGSSLAHGLSTWGFVSGAERTFQGESKRLQVVVSRTLEFRTPSGAMAYVTYVHQHPTAQFGPVGETRPITLAGRRGWIFTLAACACHMANPSLIGLANHGSRVTWLEINGPTADIQNLRALLGSAP
jgi:hypothetical protein